METSQLKKFAQHARCSLMEQVTSKLRLVLAQDSPARRESSRVVAALEQQIKTSNEEQVAEKVAYIWFNRFCALRFMDVNQYNRIAVVSPVEGQVQPEILAEAKAGYIDDAMVDDNKRELITQLLNGTNPSRDPQTEAYRHLIVAVCNDYHRIMPYLFERISDYTELLMPDDLLSENSILAYTREAMTAEACESVEVIGWLYQFYISEKKDEVFAGLKKNRKVTPENIPAATQLFTPHWIVRYLVENSLGRLWMLNHPDSRLTELMDYYIPPDNSTSHHQGQSQSQSQSQEDFLHINSPEELKICDPACGSGHMLTYAYDLLYAIYLDAGYDPIEIPGKILSQNLYGIEIDERAAELSAFALTMKAMKGNPANDSNNRRRFFRKPIKPNICCLEKIQFSETELDDYMDFIGKELQSTELRETLQQFAEADNFGALIQPAIQDAAELLSELQDKDLSGQMSLDFTAKDISLVHENALKALKQADYISQKYHIVIANPPYMGSKGMNGRLGKWAKDNYPDSKSDLFAMFIERGFQFVKHQGFSAMVTMQSWMFLSSYEKLRIKLLNQVTIECMAHMANMVMGIAFGTSATVWRNQYIADYRGAFCYVEYDDIGKGNKPIKFPPDNKRNQSANK
jgi:hypothetical protein